MGFGNGGKMYRIRLSAEQGHAVSNGLAWTTRGGLAFKASESYSGRRTHPESGLKKPEREEVSTSAWAGVGQQGQIKSRRAQVAAWCSEYCAGWGRAFKTMACAGLQLC